MILATDLSRCMRACTLALTLWLCSLPAVAQVNMEAFQDYFLVGRFGEVCTMCEVVVLCEPGTELPREDAVPESGDFTVYHLQTRTFWSQIATIWEWFISNFSQAELASQGHTRPVHVYTVTEGNWSPLEVVEGRLVLEPGVLEFGDYKIDRTNRAWQSATTGEPVGFCSRLPLWDALDSIEANAPGGEQ